MTSGLKGTMSDSELKILVSLAMLVLLTGLGLGGERLTADWFPSLAIMLGLFGLCLSIVKRAR